MGNHRKSCIALLLLAALAVPWIAAEEGAAFSAIPAGEEVAASGGTLTLAKAVVLGIVEGLTEYLPVSSTGHLTVAERLMGIGTTPEDKLAADAYTIVIQGGAILAVLLVSLRRIAQMLRGIVGRDRHGLRLVVNLLVAFVPAALIGYLFEGPIRARLFGTWPVVAAWVVGGAGILALTRWRAIDAEGGAEGQPARELPLESLPWRHALAIGLAQCLALWPGVSRSLVTIVVALLLGLSMSAAVEFSFLLGLLTLGAATGHEAITSGREIITAFGWATPVVGFVVAAVAGFLAVRWMVAWLKRRSLSIFGWYRIGIGAVVAVLALVGVV